MLISRKILEIVSLNLCLHKKIVKLSYGTYFKVDFTNNSWNCYSTCVRTKKSLNRITDFFQSWFDGKFLKLWTLGHFRFEGKFKVLASGLSSSLLSTPPIEVLPLVGKFCRKLIQIVKKGLELYHVFARFDLSPLRPKMSYIQRMVQIGTKS